MRMATTLTAIGKPPPICPYVFPSSDDPTPRRANVVASPNANAAALQHDDGMISPVLAHIAIAGLA